MTTDLVSGSGQETRINERARLAARTATAAVGSIVVLTLLLAALGADPVSALDALLQGALGSSFAVGQTVMLTCVLALLALAAAIPFRARIWNVGTEGQLYMGALFAVAVALEGPKGLPSVVTVPLLCIAGAVGGALWALLAALLRTKMGANEVIVTLMLQFVAILLASWATLSVWPSGLGLQTETLPENWWMPEVFGLQVISVGVLVTIGVVILMWLIVTRSDIGFRIDAVGHNSRAAELAGIRVGWTQTVAFGLGGACAGLAGSIVVAGWFRELIGEVAFGFGFLGIAAALVARLSPLGVVPAAFLFALLTNGSNTLQVEAGISPAVGSVLIGVFVVGLLAAGVIKMSYPEVTE